MGELVYDGVSLKVFEGDELVAEIFLDGSVRLERKFYLKTSSFDDVVRFLDDFLRRRKIVRFDGSGHFFSIPDVSYGDCELVALFGRKSNESEWWCDTISLKHNNFGIILNEKYSKLEVRTSFVTCAVGYSVDYLTKFISSFYPGLFDINAVCRFELEGDDLVIYVNGKKRFRLGLDYAEFFGENYFIYRALKILGGENFYNFILNIIGKYAHNFNFKKKGRDFIFRLGNFRSLMFSSYNFESFYYLNDGNPKFEIILNREEKYAMVLGKPKNSGYFECYVKSAGIIEALNRSKLASYVKALLL